MSIRSRLLMLAAAVALVAAGCSSSTTGSGTSGTGTTGQSATPVSVGSKIDTEGGVLGEMIVALLENEGITVNDKTKTGTTDVVRAALLSGEIDIYPEYTGTALTQFFPKATISAGVSADAKLSWETVRDLDKANKITWLDPAPANNTWAIAIPRKLADANKITTLADWAAYIKGGGAVKLVGSQEFVDRKDALPAFEAAYGFKLGPDQLIILSGGDTAQTEAAASQGTNGANAAMAYGTDGSLAAFDLVVLGDPKGVQPVYQPAPIVRTEVLDRYPKIADVLNPVFQGLTLEKLQKLNAEVAVNGKDPRQVARDYLKAEGYLK